MPNPAGAICMMSIRFLLALDAFGAPLLVLAGIGVGIIVLRQVPSPLEALGVMWVMIGVAVHKPVR